MSTDTVSLFISYSHKDEALRDELMPFLAPMRGALIADWHDRKIAAGAQWDAEIDAQLHSADIIVMLMSQDFLASEYITKTEVPAALARHEAGHAVVIPVILRTFSWYGSPLAHLQSVPRDKKAVTTWSDRDSAYVAVADAIREEAQRLLAQRQAQAELRAAAGKRYRQKVDEMLSDGLISLVERETLDELRASLALPAEAAAAIEAEANQPFRQYHEGLEKYRKTMLKVLAVENPISAPTRKDLDLRKRDLGLKDADVVRLEAHVMAEFAAQPRAAAPSVPVAPVTPSAPVAPAPARRPAAPAAAAADDAADEAADDDEAGDGEETLFYAPEGDDAEDEAAWDALREALADALLPGLTALRNEACTSLVLFARSADENDDDIDLIECIVDDDGDVVVWVRRDVPPELALPKAERKRLVEEFGMAVAEGEVAEQYSHYVSFGPVRRVRPEAVVGLVVALLTDPLGLPRDDIAIGCRLE